MIAKCIALLAIVAQINAGCVQQTCVVQNCGPCGMSGGSTRNLIAKGKYPVHMKNCGPVPDCRVPVTTSHVTAPCQEKPCVRLPCNIPAPKTVSHCCACFKTILRPRVHQQIITVPTIQRYIETTHKPVVENVQYEAVPLNCNENNSGVQLVQVQSGSCSSPVQSVQTIQIPQIQTIQVPCNQNQQQCVQLPTLQAVEVPKMQTCELSQLQTIQVPQTISFGSSCNTC